jgi:hypothetical protein
MAAVLAALVVVLAVSRMDRPPSGEEAGEEARADLGRRLERLRSLPYATVTPEKVEPSEAGVIVHDIERACPGYNLYCSGVKPEAYLMNMSGEIVHTWAYPEITPWRWRAVEMLDNGDLLVINKLHALIKLDWQSNLVWSRPIQVHHDVTVAEGGALYVPAAATTLYRGVAVKFDVILLLDSLGEEIDRWWSYEHLDDIRLAFDETSFLDGILDSLEESSRGNSSSGNAADPAYGKPKGQIYDYFHLNTVNLLPLTPLADMDSRFSPGNLLVCFRNINQVAVIDTSTMKILWTWGEGELEWPHYPVMLEDGNILIYDNGVVREFSRVIEVNPMTGEIEWEYRGDPPESFYSATRGAAQRLPNGNTLICHSTDGRVFEVTPTGETVWEWLNPATQDGHRVQVVRMYRIPPEDIGPGLILPGSEK